MRVEGDKMKEQRDSLGGGYPMPDVAKTQGAQLGRLDRVGMSGLDTPLTWKVGDETLTLTAKSDAYVNLANENAKGIHMSRLFLAVGQHLGQEAFTPATLKALLKDFVDSHKDLSTASTFKIKFELPVKRKALKSDNWGWRQYPVEIHGLWSDGKLKIFVGVEVLYSSTCPCSAALARQLIQMQFKDDFKSENISRDEVTEWLGSEKGIVATPHSQRSSALVKVQLADGAEDFNVLELIDALEGELKTVVQAAVKRVDEQEFALINGQNLMFCEDASRKLFSVLSSLNFVQDFWAQCTHFESLHAHDAVSVVTKGVPGGFGAQL